MIAWLTLAALGGPIALDRVDLIAAGPGTFLNYDLPIAGSDISRTAIRFIEQVQPVWRTPVDHLYVGTSITSQSLIWDAPLGDTLPLNYVVALETSLLVPRGARAGVATLLGPVRFEAGVSAISPSGWARLDYNTWTIMPTIGLGLARQR